MKKYDLIGLPFPIDTEAFKSDNKCLGLIKRIEDYVEIRMDLLEAISALHTASELINDQAQIKLGMDYHKFRVLCESTVAHATMLYSKVFNNGGGRSTLNWKHIGQNAPENISSAHSFFRDLRNKHFAHAEWRLNKHTLYVLPSHGNTGPIAMASSQVKRLSFAESYEWENLADAAQFVVAYLDKHITEDCESLSASLTVSQVGEINLRRRLLLCDVRTNEI